MIVYVMLCGILLSITVGCCVYLFIKTSKGNKFTDSLIKLLLFDMIISVSYGMYILTDKLAVAFVCGTLYSISTSWITIFMLEYTFVLTGITRKKRIVLRFSYLFAILDTLSLIINIKLHHLFNVVPAPDNHVGYKNFMGQYATGHIVTVSFGYLVALIILVTLVKNILSCASLYRRRYFTVLVAFLIVMASNLSGYLIDSHLDYSIIFYSLASIFLCHATLDIFPRELVAAVNNNLVTDYHIAVLCFDTYNKCIAANKQALRLFNAKYAEIEQHILSIKDRFSNLNVPIKEWDDIYYKSNQPLYMHYYYQNLTDKKGRSMGYYILMEDVTEEFNSIQEERFKNTHDDLTNLYNSNGFFNATEDILTSYPQTKYRMITTNIKDFKLINNLFGTDIGDAVLMNIADFLRENTDETNICGRISGDRFAILIKKSSYDEDVLNRLSSNLVELFDQRNYIPEIVFGVFDITDINEPAHNMYNKANIAIKSQKDSSGNIVFYDEELMNRIIYERELIQEFDKAILDEQFCIYIQPQVDNNGRTTGGEALVRWNHPDKGVLSPGMFVDVYENTGHIHILDCYVWELAARTLEKWKNIGREDMYISVNISVRDFYYLDVYDEITKIVQKHNISPQKLKLEITESVMGIDRENIISTLEKLRDFGFTIEIDDFGSGYSSLNRLKDIPADVLKIDMLFMSTTKNNAKRKAITDTIIFLGKKLGMEIITEGIETEEQFNELSEAGCDMYQGYYFSRPISVPEFEELYM